MTLQLLQPEIIKANGAILAKYIGGAIEQVSPTAFKGHGIRWHKNRPDLQGEHFSPKTYLMRNAGYPVKGIPANYQHGLHKDFGNLAIGMIRFADEDEFGLFIEGELKTREEYIEMLKEIGRKADVKFTDNQLASKSALMVKEVDMLVSKVPMQFSGGFDPSTWIVDPDTKHIDQAGMIHLAFTPTPADDLNPMVRFKSALQEVLKYEPSTVYSLPSQLTDSPTVPTGGTDHKAVDGASADNEAAQPNAQPTTDNKIPPKTGAKKKMAKKKKNNRFSHIRQEFEEQVGEVASEVFEELAEVVEDIAQEFGISLDPAEVEDIAETVEEEIVSEIEDVEEAPVMMMDDEEDEDEQKHKKSLDVNKLRQKAYFKAYAKIGALQQKRSQQKDSARQVARNKWQQQQPATSHLPAYTGNGNNGHDGHKSNNITVSGDRRFENWKPEDFLFAAMIDKQVQAKGKQGIISDATKFYREFAERAERGDYMRHLPAKAVSALKAIKANELNHSTQANYGDEWVPDSWDNNLWRKARLDTVVMPQFRVVDMPTNPFQLPIEGTDSTMYFVPETTAEEQLTLDNSNSPIPDSKIGSGKVQLSAKKFGTRVGFSAELEEDSIIPVLSIYREQAETAFNEGIDDVLLNGDTETGTTNINSDGSALAATSRYLAFNGLRKNTFTNSTNQVDAAGASPTLNHIRQIRFLLSRQVSTKLPGLRIFTNPEAYSGLLKMDEFLTMDKAGPNATAQTGQIGIIDGIPVFVTDQLPLTDADGKVTAAGNGVNRGTIVMAYAPHWYVGYRRRLAVDLSYIPYYDSYQLTLTARMDFVVRDTDSVAVLYNVGI